MLTAITGNVSDAPLEPNSFDACLCDPPYGLGFMGKAWDKALPPTQDWKHIFAALKPGAHMLVFGGSRTFHRLAVSLEDAGFELRDTFCWLYGQGMPKSLDASKALDKHATELAKLWTGYGTALKPAWEPILLVRKPLSGTVAETIELYGTAAINIDGCRIPRATDDVSGWSATGSNASENRALSGRNYDRAAKPDAALRWPANVLLDEAAGAALDKAAGPRRSTLTGKADPSQRHLNPSDNNGASWFAAGAGSVYADSGGPSRFFYCAKASPSERGADNNHPTVKPLSLLRYLATLIKPPTANASLLVPYSGSGSEVIGASQAGWENITSIEREQAYIDIMKRRLI